MIKVLITGANGQLGSEIRKLKPFFSDWEFVFTDVDELDITSEKAVVGMLNQIRPDWLINCAAYTAVDKAESDEDNATLLNVTAPSILAKESARLECHFIHVSTDYVFDGKAYKPYKEDDPVCPVSVYGKTKLEGEQKCMENNPQSMIVRTAWLYSSFGNNFVKTMIRLGKERAELGVVYDQVGSPTYAGDLANALLAIILKCENEKNAFIPGIYHYSNEGVCSWYDLALSVHQLYGIKNCNVSPICSNDYPTPAPRPHFSVFSKSKIKQSFGITIPHWTESLKVCVKEIVSQG